MPPTALSDLHPDATVGDWLPCVLTTTGAKLQDHAVGAGQGDPDGIHDLRVAARRLRSHLRTFEPLLDESWAEERQVELSWLGGEIGRVRDLDVLLEWLDDRSPTLTNHLERQRAAAQTALQATLDSDRARHLLDAVAEPPTLAAADDLDVTEPAHDLAVPLADRTWRRLRKAVRALPDDPPDRALHRVRIRAKRCRYAAEVVEPLVGPEAAKFAKALSKLQDVLGKHQDTVLAEATFRVAPSELIDAIHEERRDLRKQWPTVWEAASKKSLRRWMHGE